MPRFSYRRHYALVGEFGFIATGFGHHRLWHYLVIPTTQGTVHRPGYDAQVSATAILNSSHLRFTINHSARKHHYHQSSGAKRNKAYSQTIQAAGGVVPYSWSIVSGSLPPGLSLNASTGAVTGKATAIGLYSFTVRAVDSQATPASDTQDLSIRVTR
jgi:hypothetical protein